MRGRVQGGGGCQANWMTEGRHTWVAPDDVVDVVVDDVVAVVGEFLGAAASVLVAIESVWMVVVTGLAAVAAAVVIVVVAVVVVVAAAVVVGWLLREQ